MYLLRKGLSALAIVIGTAAPVWAQAPPHVHPAPETSGGRRMMQDGPSGTVVGFTVGGGRRVLARRGFEGVLPGMRMWQMRMSGGMGH